MLSHVGTRPPSPVGHTFHALVVLLHYRRCLPLQVFLHLASAAPRPPRELCRARASVDSKGHVAGGPRDKGYTGLHSQPWRSTSLVTRTSRKACLAGS
jgi:hypothetical protein